MKIILSYITATIILLFLLALPIAGVVAYIRLIRKMRREQITAIPKFSLFMLFLICGTLLMEILGQRISPVGKLSFKRIA